VRDRTRAAGLRPPARAAGLTLGVARRSTTAPMRAARGMLAPCPALAGREANMTSGHIASMRHTHAAPHAHADGLVVTATAATGLLAIASTVALGTVGIEAAVAAIVVLTPLVLLSVVAIDRR
jgi:hypothetical protein